MIIPIFRESQTDSKNESGNLQNLEDNINVVFTTFLNSEHLFPKLVSGGEKKTETNAITLYLLIINIGNNTHLVIYKNSDISTSPSLSILWQVIPIAPVVNRKSH